MYKSHWLLRFILQIDKVEWKTNSNLLVILHFYVITRDETFPRVKLSSVPVHVIFHIQDLQMKNQWLLVLKDVTADYWKLLLIYL